MKYLLICVFAMSLLFSCSCNKTDNKNEKANSADSSEVKQNTTEVKTQKLPSKEKEEQDAEPSILDNPTLRSKSASLAPEKLADFLPQSLAGGNRGSLTMYRSDDGYASVNTTYRFSANAGFDIRIFDNGPTAPIFDEKFFRKMPYETNMVTKKISTDKSIGYTLSEESMNNSEMNILFNNRIIINIKAFGIKNGGKDPEQILKYIKIDNILKLLK